MLDGPALTPPPGVAVDFDEVGYLNYAFPVLALLIIAPSLALAVRLYTKFFIIRQAKPEDCELFTPPPPSSSLMPRQTSVSLPTSSSLCS